MLRSGDTPRVSAGSETGVLPEADVRPSHQRFAGPGKTRTAEDPERSPMNAAMSRRPAASERVVSVRGLTKSYDGHTMVDGFDLDVYEGEVVGLIGANGAGKTTAVECIRGLRRPDRGRILVLELDPQRDADRLRSQIGSPLQNFALPDRQRVAEAVAPFAWPDAQQVLNRLPGVRSVNRTGRTVTVRGTRDLVAHLGAWLAARDEPVCPT
jgi:ABC-type glutathione transport system ATPase component